MKYAIAQEFPGAEQEIYDSVMKQMEAAPPRGLISHASSLEGGVLRTVEIWETRQDRDRFMHEQVQRDATGGASVPPHEHIEFETEHVVRP